MAVASHPDTGRWRVLVIGADLVMPKLFYFSEELRRLGYGYAIYSHDDTPASRAVAERAGAVFLAGPPHRKSIGRMVSDIATAVRSIRRRDIHHADLYCDYHLIASFAYLLLLRAKRIPVVLWCRGELYDWPVYTWWQRLFFRVAIPLAQLVILKERYMVDTLTRAGIHDPAKSIELHNTVPAGRCERAAILTSPGVRLLFLNSFKGWRNVGFCAELAAALRDAGIDFRMTIVGDKDASPGLSVEGDALRARLAQLELEELVEVAPFSEDPQGYLVAHDVFLLPADLVYCNFALLEAMNCGLVPIVSDHDGDYRLIIEDGVSGFGRPLRPAAWVEVIRDLLADHDRARDFSRAATTRIAQRFSTAGMFAHYASRCGLGPALATGAEPR